MWVNTNVCTQVTTPPVVATLKLKYMQPMPNLLLKHPIQSMSTELISYFRPA